MRHWQTPSVTLRGVGLGEGSRRIMKPRGSASAWRGTAGGLAVVRTSQFGLVPSLCPSLDQLKQSYDELMIVVWTTFCPVLQSQVAKHVNKQKDQPKKSKLYKPVTITWKKSRNH